MGRWEWFAWDKGAGPRGEGEWTTVQRDQIDHLVVYSTEHRRRLPAVDVAESQATIYDRYGQKITKGKPVKLPTGARKRQPQSQSRQQPQSGRQPQPHEGVGNPVPAGLESAVSSGPPPPVAGSCVRQSLAALGWPLAEVVPTWVDFDQLPFLISQSCWVRRLQLKKPAEWGYPALLGSGGTQSPFSAFAIEFICDYVSPNDKLLLRVHLCDNNNSNHCIAVANGYVIDPDHGAFELCPQSFYDKLKVDEIVAGYKIHALK